MTKQRFYIWSNEHKAWWAPFRQGYSETIRGAGEYPYDEAIEIVRQATYWAIEPGLEKGKKFIPDESLVPVLIKANEGKEGEK